jgi:hypothetical protein
VRCGRTDTDMFNQKSKGVTTMGRLADKNILITGGNSGIGLAAGQEINGDFYTNDYTMGRLRLRVSDDAKRITGTAQTIYGKANSIELFR